MGDDWLFVEPKKDIIKLPKIGQALVSADTDLSQTQEDLPLHEKSLPNGCRDHESWSKAPATPSSKPMLPERCSAHSESSESSRAPRSLELPERGCPSPGSPEIQIMLAEALRTDLHRSWPSAEDPKTHTLDPGPMNELTEPDKDCIPSNTTMGEISKGLNVQTLREDDLRNNNDREPLRTILALTDKQMATLGLRTQVRDIRTQVRRRRSKLSHKMFIQGAGRTGASSVEKEEPLVDLNQPDQTELEAFLMLEDEYNELEEQLDREEWDLKELESKLYRMFTSFKANGLDALPRIWPISSGPTSETWKSDQSESADELDWQRVLYNRYLSRKGDADILEEQLQTLRADRAYFFEEQRKREALNWDVNEEARDFSNTFDERHNDLQADLRRAREDAFDLRDAWLAHDDRLFKFSPFKDAPEVSDTSSYDLLSDGNVEMLRPLHKLGIISDEKFIDATLDTLPSLFERWPETPKFSDTQTNLSITIVDMPCFINKWLLHIMQQSLHHAHHFWNFLSAVKAKTAVQSLTDLYLLSELTDLVVKFWNSDGTESASAFGHGAGSASQSELSRVYTVRSMRSDSAIHKTDRLHSRFLNSNPKRPAASLVFCRIINPRKFTPYKSVSIC